MLFLAGRGQYQIQNSERPHYIRKVSTILVILMISHCTALLNAHSYITCSTLHFYGKPGLLTYQGLLCIYRAQGLPTQWEVMWLPWQVPMGSWWFPSPGFTETASSVASQSLATSLILPTGLAGGGFSKAHLLLGPTPELI